MLQQAKRMNFTRAHLFVFYGLHFLTISLLFFCLANVYYVKYPTKDTENTSTPNEQANTIFRAKRNILQGSAYYELDNDERMVENDKKQLFLTLRSKIEVNFTKI